PARPAWPCGVRWPPARRYSSACSTGSRDRGWAGLPRSPPCCWPSTPLPRCSARLPAAPTRCARSRAAASAAAASWRPAAATTSTAPSTPPNCLGRLPKRGIRVGGGSVMATGSSDYFNKTINPTELRRQLAEARDQGRPAIVELSADWCISCKIMERDILNQPSVRSAGLDDFIRVQLDVTDNTPAQRAWMTEQQLFGPPAFLFIAGDGKELADLRIQGEMSREVFVRHMQAALGGN